MLPWICATTTKIKYTTPEASACTMYYAATESMWYPGRGPFDPKHSSPSFGSQQERSHSKPATAWPLGSVCNAPTQWWSPARSCTNSDEHHSLSLHPLAGILNPGPNFPRERSYLKIDFSFIVTRGWIKLNCSQKRRSPCKKTSKQRNWNELREKAIPLNCNQNVISDLLVGTLKYCSQRLWRENY